MNSLAEITLDASLPGAASPAFPVLRLEPATRHGDACFESDVAAEATPSRACRVLNVTVAAIALLVCSPLLLVLAALVKWSSPGPVIYRQTRVGLDRRRGDGRAWADKRVVDYGGRLFTIYKFRTMRSDGDPTQQVWATPTDARVTRVGRVLRRFRLDELPQLFNVLKGDMNIVGPRPEQPQIFMSLRNEIPNYQRRQRVLPGITGWAQVNLNYDTSIDDVRRKVQLDVRYIERQSVLRDVRILLQTVPAVLQRGGW